MGIDKIADKFQYLLNNPTSNATAPYDATATVLKVDGSTVWVHIPGGVEETPVERTINARPGDNVKVRVSGGRAWIIGNNSAPPTDDYVATTAMVIGQRAELTASEAQSDAERARSAAADAESSARTASTAATNALAGLSTLESVVDTVEWFAKHKKASTDTTVDNTKTYYVYDETTGTLSEVIPEGTENPSDEGWYELNEAIANYVATHVATTDDGLYVVGASNGWKVLVSNGQNPYYPVGIHLIDPNGNKAQSTTASGISFDQTKTYYIGNSNAYIFFDPSGNGGQGSITIGGSSISMGNIPISDVLSGIETAENTLIYDHTYEYVRDSSNNPVSANFTAFLYRGGVDVKTEYPAANFTWYLKKEENSGVDKGKIIEEFIATGYTCSVDLSDCGYGAEVIGKFSLQDEAEALSTDGDNLTDVNNENLSVRATGDSVRVRDLSVSTTIFPTDKLMVVGAEDEHLVTMQTLQDYLNANLNKQVLFNTTAAWNAQVQLTSQANTLYIYTDHQIDSQGNRIAGIKVGDGNAYLIDMPFTDAVIMEHINDNIRHITAEERAFWNNKVSCYLADNDRVIFTTA